MQLKLKNRLKLISLLPISILLAITSYLVYDSYNNYKSAQVLHEKLVENKLLNELVDDISRERGMTVMYLGNKSKSTFNSLVQQRLIVDKIKDKYLKYAKSNMALHDHSNGELECPECQSIATLSRSLDSIEDIRALVDTDDTTFKDVYETVYGNIQRKAIKKLESITKEQRDGIINNLSYAYISLVTAKEYTSEERDFISYAIASSKKLSEDDLRTFADEIGEFPAKAEANK